MKSLPLTIAIGTLAGCTCGNPHLHSSMEPVEFRRSILANYALGMSRDGVREVNESLGIDQHGDRIMIRSGTCLGQLGWTPHGRVEFVYADDRLDHVVYALRFDADGWEDREVDFDVRESQP